MRHGFLNGPSLDDQQAKFTVQCKQGLKVTDLAIYQHKIQANGTKAALTFGEPWPLWQMARSHEHVTLYEGI